ncbi:hypothetical protein [Microcoleus sp. CAWBG640]|uniref:hypothetical protein n=1 Tax=Microcoleus sp. CAWBG640 TaxID=2841653 RepID=UPI00312BA38E
MPIIATSSGIRTGRISPKEIGCDRHFSTIQKGDRPSYIRVNQRSSAVKKERSPFLIIQKGDRPFYNQSWRSPFLFEERSPFFNYPNCINSKVRL